MSNEAKTAEVWVTSTDGEWFVGDEYSSREAAIRCAPEELDLLPGDNFWVGRQVEVGPPEFAEDWVERGLEDWEESIPMDWDRVDSLFSSISDETIAELTRRLNETLAAFCAEKGIKASYWQVEDVTEHCVPEESEGK